MGRKIKQEEKQEKEIKKGSRERKSRSVLDTYLDQPAQQPRVLKMPSPPFFLEATEASTGLPGTLRMIINFTA